MTTDLPTHFVAHLTTAAGKVSVNIHLSGVELEIWGLHASVPWMKISEFFSKGTTTQNRTVDGEQIIINWSAVQFVTYDNPWAHLTKDHAVKIPRS